MPTPPSDPTTDTNTTAAGAAATNNANAAQNGASSGLLTQASLPNGLVCIACRSYHVSGQCPVKLAGLEFCNLCGMAHYGQGRICPHIQSETQVRTMLETLRFSKEPQHLVDAAKRYLKGLKGHLVQIKRQKEAKEHAAREAEAAAVFQAARAPIWKTPGMGASNIGFGMGGYPSGL